jgi:adenylate kinase family enzyme
MIIFMGLAGEIISDDLTLDVLDEEFRRIGGGQNQFILDGSPRTMRQARWLVGKDQEGELKINAIIHLEVKKQLAKERLISRRRPDDHDLAIEERFREYDENIVPILKYLDKEGYKVFHLDSSGKPEAVEAEIEKALGV